MNEKTEYHYLSFNRKGITNKYSVIVADRKTGAIRIISIKAALRLHQSGCLYNKRGGNDFKVDLGAYNEAVEYSNGIQKGWKLKYKNDSYHTIKGQRKGDTCMVATSALRTFFPELL